MSAGDAACHRERVIENPGVAAETRSALATSVPAIASELLTSFQDND
jgi:hypothetical protein